MQNNFTNLGTGGEEAALFAADVLNMYERYASLRKWKFEKLSIGEDSIGAVKVTLNRMNRFNCIELQKQNW